MTICSDCLLISYILLIDMVNSLLCFSTFAYGVKMSYLNLFPKLLFINSDFSYPKENVLCTIIWDSLHKKGGFFLGGELNFRYLEG